MKPIPRSLRLTAPQNAHRVVVVSLLLLLAVANQAYSLQVTPNSLQAQIACWIQELNDDDFAVREHAFKQIQKVGLPAFDALNGAAISTNEMELRWTVQRLLKKLEHTWVKEITSPAVQELAHEYIHGNLNRKQACIAKLATLDSTQARLALLHICHYEPEPLSRIAALPLLRMLSIHALPHHAMNREKISAEVDQHVAQASRVACQWLVAAVHSDSFSEIWQSLCQTELEYVTVHPNLNPLDHHARTDLVQWYLNECYQSTIGPQLETIESEFLRSVRETDVTSTLIWLESCGRHQAINQLAIDHASFINTQPLALMILTASHYRRGDFDSVAKTLELADKATGKHGTYFYQLAAALDHLGYESLAERSYLKTIEISPSDTAVHIQARLALSHSMKRRGDFQATNDQLMAVYDLAKDNSAIQQVLKKYCGVECRQLLAEAKFAQAMKANQEQSQRLSLLIEAAEKDPGNSDVMIELHRFGLGEIGVGKSDTTHKIEELVFNMVSELDRQVVTFETRFENATQPRAKKLARTQLAILLNRTAWVRGNIGSELERAIEAAERAVRIQPGEPAFLDTLAFCHFRNGKINQAVQFQSRAVQLAIGNAKYQQQLEFFMRVQQNRAVAKLPNPRD